MAQTFEDAGMAGREFIDNSLKSFAAFSKGMQALTVEAGSAALEKLVSAKSLEKVVEIQADYARSSYESFVAEAGKVNDIYAEMTKDAYKPFEGMLAKVK